MFNICFVLAFASDVAVDVTRGSFVAFSRQAQISMFDFVFAGGLDLYERTGVIVSGHTASN